MAIIDYVKEANDYAVNSRWKEACECLARAVYNLAEVADDNYVNGDDATTIMEEAECIGQIIHYDEEQ